MLKKHLTLFVLLCSTLMTAMADNVYTIYPVPQSQSAGAGTVSFTPQVTIVADSIIDQATIERAQEILKENGLEPVVGAEASATGSNLWIGVDASTGPADRKATALNLNRSVLSTEGKYDRHILCLFAEADAAQVVIVGESVNAAFYALASLEQMLERGTANMPTVTINDYADQQIRGLVEGYYGYPYSVAVKKSLMRFMMRMKMNTYMYGAKSDTYHSADWEKPYPTSLTAQQVRNGLLSQDMVRDITRESARTKVNFIWAIHPGNSFVSDQNIVTRIMNKYTSMYALGVRQFAVFVDDVGVPTTDADCKTNADHLTALQQAIDAKWNTPGTAAEDQVKPLHFVPQVYTLSWVSKENRQRFYKALGQVPDKITIYITGNGVWTVPNASDLNTVREELGRNAAWWWNYPCNDNADGQLYTSDMYTNFWEMPAVSSNATLPAALPNGLGIVSNPMQEGMVSRQPLFSVADYAWNNGAFNNQSSWEASFNATFSTPEKAGAYKALAPYLRWNDPDDINKAIANYKSGNTAVLTSLLEGIKANINVVNGFENSHNTTDSLLYLDIAPWIRKLEAMVDICLGMSKTKNREATTAQKWETYAHWLPQIDNLETDTLFTAYALEGLGYNISVSERQAQPSQKYFYPFMDWLRKNTIGSAILGRTTTAQAAKISNPENATGSCSFDKSLNKVYLNTGSSAIALPPGGYYGMTLTTATRPAALTLADTLLTNYNVSYSPDGKTWEQLSPGESIDGYVKHLAVVNNTTSTQYLKLSRLNFGLILPAHSQISAVRFTTTEGGENTTIKSAYDGDPATFFAPKHDQVVGDTYTLTLAAPTTVSDVRFYFGTKNGDYLQKGRMEVSTDSVRWTRLHLKGSTAQVAGNDEATPYTDEIKYLDFEGNVENAKYVRLVVTAIPGKKWLRIYDFQVNNNWYNSQFAAVVTDSAGQALDEAVDKKAYTCVENAQGGIYYHFLNIKRPSSLSVFWTPEAYTGPQPKVEISADGTNWTGVGSLSAALTEVDLSSAADVSMLRIVCEDGSTPPVYEIVETLSQEDRPVVTALSQATVPAAGTTDAVSVYTVGGLLVGKNMSPSQIARLPKGLYIINGKKILVR